MPSILFDQPEDHDIFVLRDQTGTLSSVTYQESGTAGTADDYIRIRTPDSISFTASNEIENYLQYSGNAATKVLDVRRAQDTSNDLETFIPSNIENVPFCLLLCFFSNG